MNPRNLQILDRLPADHVLRESAAACLELSERLRDRRNAIDRDPKLTHQGKQIALREYVEKTYLPGLKEAQAPIGRAAAELAGRREALKLPMPDRNDLVGAFERSEIRAWLRSLTPLDRQSVLIQNSDPRIADAVLSVPRQLSDLSDDVFNKLLAIERERRFGKQVKEIEDEQRIVDEASAAHLIARQDAKAIAGIDDREFETLIQNSRGETPWLMRQGAKVVRVRPGESNYPEASADEIAIGKYYAGREEWAADNPLADSLLRNDLARRQREAA